MAEELKGGDEVMILEGATAPKCWINMIGVLEGKTTLEEYYVVFIEGKRDRHYIHKNFLQKVG